MSGMDMLDMLPSDKDRVRVLETEFKTLKDRTKYLEGCITELESEMAYWKDRSVILEKYCKSARTLFNDDAIKRIAEDSHIIKAESIEDESIVTQDKVENQEGVTPVEAVADTEESSPVVVPTDTASANTEDYKLIAEKAKAENAVLREEIESLHEAMRFIQVLSRPDSQSKTPKVTGSIQ